MNNDVIIRIEGHSELIRDPKTGAVINTATTEYNRFIEKKNKERSQQKRILELEDKLNTLEENYTKLESLLLQILNKNK